MYEASKRMSPTPRIPGYIPGMQRPMTPHDIPEFEEQLSVTPRARSPRLPLNGSYNGTMNMTNSSLARRDSNASTAKQPSRTGTPLSTNPGGFLSRSLNGRYTPTEERQGSDPFDSDRNPSKRRPASPLSTTSFQSMMPYPNESPSTFSRPTTPSSAAMLQSQPLQQQPVISTSSFRPTHIRHGSGHSRSGSISSLNEVLHNPDFNRNTATTSAKPDANKTITRNLRSTALPDSPYLESGRFTAQGYSPGDKERVGDHERAPSVIPGTDLGSPSSFSRMLRSPTPNGNVPPTTTTTRMGSHQESVGKRAKSPSFSIDQPTSTFTTTTKMGKHQKHESGSSFVLSLGPSTQPLVLTPFLNSSRSSFGSEGSSYHSMDEENGKKDRVKALFAKIEGEPPEWHDFADVSADNSGVPGGLEVSFRSLMKEEEFVKQLSGLNKEDFAAIQERLLDVAQSKVDRGDRDKAGSVMKKRRPSTSQSFYTNGAATNGGVSALSTFLLLPARLTKNALPRLEALHQCTRGPHPLLQRTCYHPFRPPAPRLPRLRPRPSRTHHYNLPRFRLKTERGTPFSIQCSMPSSRLGLAQPYSLRSLQCNPRARTTPNPLRSLGVWTVLLDETETSLTHCSVEGTPLMAPLLLFYTSPPYHLSISRVRFLTKER